MRPTDRRRKVLLNMSTINIGGGIQVAVAMVREIFRTPVDAECFEWILVVSPEIEEQLKIANIHLRPGIDLCLTPSPARSKTSRRALRDFADKHADRVFTLFGPAYVRFAQPHLCGFADSIVTHSTWLFFSTLPNWTARIRQVLLCFYKAWWIRYADAWVVEAEATRSGLIKRLKLPGKKVHVVPNNCSYSYLENQTTTPLPPASSGTTHILSFSAYYPHKGLEIIPQVIKLLIDQYKLSNIKWFLTIPHAIYERTKIPATAKYLNVEQYIENLGPIPVKEGPDLFRKVDILFHPTILEAFSATYPEAMAMDVPIVTSDLDFARSICGPAAAYFKPLSPPSAAEQLSRVISDTKYREQLVHAGRGQLLRFPSPTQRLEAYRVILNNIT